MHLVRRWPVRSSLPCLLSLLGCTASIDGSGDLDAASSPDPCQGVTCNEGFSCLEAACVPADPCDGVECLGEDERCSGGRCSSCQADEDADGFEACIDCDDGDATVVPGTEAPCESACGLGSVRCLGLAGWSHCSAPLDCTCDPGDVRSEPCGACGTATRPCDEQGRWGLAGSCTESGECLPGTVQTEACGDCSERERECSASCTWGAWTPCASEGACAPGDSESQECADGEEQSRTCGDDCSWGAWSTCDDSGGTCDPGASESDGCGRCGARSRSCGDDGEWADWGSCADEGECTAGETDDRACGGCGTESRTCSAECTWSAWSGCAAEGECTPGETREGECDACSEQRCGDDCTWGACALQDGSDCEWRGGGNWRCCGAGQWQFCLPDACVWSTECAACSGCGC